MLIRIVRKVIGLLGIKVLGKWFGKGLRGVNRIDWYRVNGVRGEFFVINGSEHCIRLGQLREYLNRLDYGIYRGRYEIYKDGIRYDSKIFWEYIMGIYVGDIDISVGGGGC